MMRGGEHLRLLAEAQSGNRDSIGELVVLVQQAGVFAEGVAASEAVLLKAGLDGELLGRLRELIRDD